MILFELGRGDATALCVQWKQSVCGGWSRYWYSRAFQTHNVNFGRLLITWRIGPYRYTKGGRA